MSIVKLMRAIKATGAQNDVRKINEKHRTGMIGRVMAGMFPSKPNYGYVEVFKPSGEFDHYETEQDKINVVLHIIHLYLDKGWGHRVIADMLNRDGVAAPDSEQWGYGSVAFILRHVWQYAGFGELNRRNPSGRAYLRHPGIWPAVISEETARRVLSEMESRDKSPRSVSNTYRFSRMLICHVCGSPMSVNRMSSKGYTYTYYRCDGNHSRIREHEVAGELRAHIIWLQDTAHREQIIADVDVISTASIMAEMERYQAAIDKAQAGIKRADDDHYIHGRLDSERYASIVASAQRAIANAQAEITKLQDRLHEAEKAATLAAQLETIQEYGLEYLDMEDVREANAWLHAHFRVYVDGKTVVAIDNF